MAGLRAREVPHPRRRTLNAAARQPVVSSRRNGCSRSGRSRAAKTAMSAGAAARRSACRRPARPASTSCASSNVTLASSRAYRAALSDYLRRADTPARVGQVRASEGQSPTVHNRPQRDFDAASVQAGAEPETPAMRRVPAQPGGGGEIRTLAGRNRPERFSRPPHSTALPPLQSGPAGPSYRVTPNRCARRLRGRSG
jgi:hypothetical protein